jgi:2-phospho-L-lactate guanylyltransferase
MAEPRAGLWAVVPVKLFAETKQRLAPFLSPSERSALARAMLSDVLSALTQAHALEGVLVVTGDAEAAAVARSAGALVLHDNENAGTSAAANAAARHLSSSKCAGMLVVPADVPLITSGDIDRIIATHREAPSVTLVPASMDGGTNALACSPPGVVPFCFGDESFARHRDAARTRGIEPQIVRLARFGQDIDRPEDVAAFLQTSSPTATYACLSAGSIAERLRTVALSP